MQFLHRKPYQEYVKGLLNYDFMKSDDKKKFDECIYLIKRRSLMSQKEKLSVQFEEAKDSKERKEILAQIDRVEKQLKQMKKNGGYYG